MAQEILDINYIREKSILNNNIDWNLLQPMVLMIQDLKLEPLLGTDLYRLILAQTTPDIPITDPKTYSTLTPNNKLLVDNHILPILHWYLISECCVPMYAKFMNKGIMTRSGETSQPVTLDDLKFLENRYANIAQDYAQKMRKYLIANTAIYPAYLTNATVDKLQPEKSGYNIGWYLPDYPNGIYPKHQNDSGPLNSSDPNYYYP